LSLAVLSEFRFLVVGAVREGTCVPNAMPGVSHVATVGSHSGSHIEEV
jgi:hypothetical protein